MSSTALRSKLRLVTLVTLLACPLVADAGTVNAFFDRGDANLDGTLNIADPVATLGFLFSGGAPLECEDAGDANDDGQLNIADAVYTLNYLFTGNSAPPPPPFGVLGDDPTTDPLGCNPIDCADTAEVTAALALLQGTFPVPGAVPAQTVMQSGVTVVIQQADAEVTVSSVAYDPVTHTFTATGTAGAPAVPITVTAFLINVSCNVAVTADWTLTGSLDTTPIANGASQVTGVTPGSVMATISNENIDFSLCSGLSAISGILNALFLSAIQDSLDTVATQLEAQVSAAVDQVIGTTPLIVCD